jgi:hypothetical protein
MAQTYAYEQIRTILRARGIDSPDLVQDLLRVVEARERTVAEPLVLRLEQQAAELRGMWEPMRRSAYWAGMLWGYTCREEAELTAEHMEEGLTAWREASQ